MDDLQMILVRFHELLFFDPGRAEFIRESSLDSTSEGKMTMKTCLHICFVFPNADLMIKVTHMELVSRKGVMLTWCLTQVAKLPWELPKGPGPGGECFAPCFVDSDTNIIEHCAPAQRFCVRTWSFGVRRRHFDTKFHDF